MKKICLFAFLLSSNLAFGQMRHEIKLDVLQGLLRSAFVSYEIAPTKHFGVEIGLGHRWDKIGFFAPVSSESKYQSFDRNNGQILLAAKFYPSKRANGDRWFLGGYFIEEYELNRDPKYDQAYLEAFGTPSSSNRNVRSGLGATTGFKRVYKNRIIIELGMAFDVDVAGLVAKKDEVNFELSGMFNFKVGYRFSGPKVEESSVN